MATFTPFLAALIAVQHPGRDGPVAALGLDSFSGRGHLVRVAVERLNRIATVGVEIEPRMEVCCRCFLVWMEKTSLLALGMPAGRDRSAELQAIAEADALRETHAIDLEVRRAIAQVVAGELVAALPPKTGV